MTYSHLIVKTALQSTKYSFFFFNYSSRSHTLKTVVTLTQSHTPTTTVSQRTRIETNTSVSKHTNTEPHRWGRPEKFPSTWVTFRLSSCLSVYPSLVSQVCSQAFPSQKLCLFWGRWWDLMTNPLFAGQQNWSDFADVCYVFPFFPTVCFLLNLT